MGSVKHVTKYICEDMKGWTENCRETPKKVIVALLIILLTIFTISACMDKDSNRETTKTLSSIAGKTLCYPLKLFFYLPCQSTNLITIHEHEYTRWTVIKKVVKVIILFFIALNIIWIIGVVVLTLVRLIIVLLQIIWYGIRGKTVC